MRRTHLRRVALPITAGLWLGACVSPAPPPPTATPVVPVTDETKTPEPPRALAARVNGRPITREAFAAAVDQNMVRYRSAGHQLPPSIELRVREAVLRRMIEDTILAQKADELGLSVTDAQVRAAYTEHTSRFRSAEAFAEYLERAHRTEAQVRDELRRQLLRDAVVARLSGQVEVTEDEIRQYFDEHRSRFVDREQIHASRILVRVARDASDEQVHRAAELARKLQREATRDPSTFADLARQHSHGPQAARGGDLGWFARGRMPPAWDEVAFALEPGTVSPTLRTDPGFEIVAVWDHRAARELPFEEVTDQIKATLSARKRQEKRRAVLRELEAASEIDLFIETDEAVPPAG